MHDCAPNDCTPVIEKRNVANPINKSNVMEMVMRSYTVAAMYESKAQRNGMHRNGATDVVSHNPHRGVVANEAFAKDELRLMMCSTSLKKTSGDKNDEAITVAVSGAALVFAPRLPHAPTDDASTNSCVPFWYVGPRWIERQRQHEARADLSKDWQRDCRHPVLDTH